MKSLKSVLKKAASIWQNASEYDLVEQANGDKFATKPNDTYMFDVESAVRTGRFTPIMLELFIERGYMVDGGVVVCPASIQVLEIDTTTPDNKKGVIPLLNIKDVVADPALRGLIISAPIEFLTKITENKGDTNG